MISTSKNQFKVLHISFADDNGGAAIAARRLLAAERAAGLDAKMLVINKCTDNPAVEAPLGWLARRKIRVTRFVVKRLGQMGAIETPEMMRSFGLRSSGMGQAIAREEADLVHLHWIGGEMISLSELAGIKAPVVWTCHDMWLFCGAEHYSESDRFENGYHSKSHLDIDAYIFRQKQKSWQNWHPTLVCPSNWISGEAHRSLLMQDALTRVIPNALDEASFQLQNKIEARDRLGLPQAPRILLFGADGGRNNTRKGFDLLEAAISQLRPSDREDIVLATFGGNNVGTTEVAGFPTYEFGFMANQQELGTLYAAADLFVSPSKMDVSSNTLLEAQLCGVPGVAFDLGGISDIITAPIHGALVPPFDVKKLAGSIAKTLGQRSDDKRSLLREDAINRFGSKVVAAQHIELYRQILNRTGNPESQI